MYIDLVIPLMPCQIRARLIFATINSGFSEDGGYEDALVG